ncbi:MAG: 6-carboxytetrahydropterin synthase [Crenarchaeota archaeon]|nr:6-carboxytetrahydropterin synthase [Thermoproteota archaeon]
MTKTKIVTSLLNNFMFEVTKEINVEYAHRLLNYEDPFTGEPGPCANLHGHSGIVRCTISGNLLEPNCMVLDFKIIKHILKEAVGTFDHALVLEEKDPLVDVLKDQGIRLVLVDNAPTAEYLSVLAIVSINSMIISLHVKNGLDIDQDDGAIIQRLCEEKLCTKIEWFETAKAKATVNLTPDLLISSIMSVRHKTKQDQNMN